MSEVEPGVRGSNRKPPSRKLLAAAAAGAFALFALGIVLIVRNKENEEVARVANPGPGTIVTPPPGGKIEVANDTQPAAIAATTAAKPPVSFFTPTTPPSSAGSPPPGDYALSARHVNTRAPLDLSQPITLEAYITPAADDDGPYNSLYGIFAVGIQRFKGNWSLLLYAEKGKPIEAKSNIAVVARRRTHLAAVVTPQAMRLYVDGVLAASQDLTNFSRKKRTEGFMIFHEHSCPDWIDEIRISKSARYDKNFTPQARFEPDADTLALYHCDEGTGDVLHDASGHGYDGGIVDAKWVRADGSPITQPPPGDYALEFDGEPARVHIPLLLDVAHPFTLEGRAVHRGDFSEVHRVLKSGDQITLGVGGDRGWQGTVDSESEKRRIRLARKYSSEERAAQLALVYDGRELRLYVDGMLAAAEPCGNLTTLKERLAIGAWFGTIDEVRISKSARYTGNYTPQPRFGPDADTLALYHFDEGTGDVLHDASGNGRDGTIVGAKWVRADGSPVGVPPSGGIGPAKAGTPTPPSGDYALDFDGVGRVDVPTLIYDGLHPLTVEATLALTQKVNGPRFAVSLRKEDSTYVKLQCDSDAATGLVSWLVFAPKRSRGSEVRSGNLQIGEQHHVALVWDGRSTRIFIDGRPGATPTTVPYGPPKTLSSGLFLGYLGDIDEKTAYFPGRIDEVRVSKTARYDKDFTPQSRFEPDADTLALYHFDEGTGDVLHDASGNGRDGKIVGAKWVRADGSPLAGAVASAVSSGPAPAMAGVKVDDAWLKQVAALVPEQQIEAVTKKLQELNPNYDGVSRHQIESGKVVRFDVNTDRLTDISPIRALAGLQNLSCSGSYDRKGSLTDLSPLAGMALQNLGISNNPVSDLTALRGMPLTKLAIGRSKVTDLSTLAGMSLTALSLDGLDVADLTPLKRMPLEDLSLYGCGRIVDFSPLDGMPLKTLNLFSTNISSEYRAKLQQALPGCKISPAAGSAPTSSTTSQAARQPAAPPPAVAPFDAAQARAHQEAWAEHLGTTVETTNSVGMKMVLIPPGEFLMGSTEAELEDSRKAADELRAREGPEHRVAEHERPQYRVAISHPFSISATEITIGQFKAFAATGYQTEAETSTARVKKTYLDPGYAVTDDFPVVEITAREAAAFCEWLMKQEAANSDGAPLPKYRLPNEAEWEYACRAGTTTPYSCETALLDQHAWYVKNGRGSAHPIAQKVANAFGLFDMHGNAYEWCDGVSEESLRTNSVFAAADAAANRVLRGGSWLTSASGPRSANRYSPSSPSIRSDHYGFRVVREIVLPSAPGIPQPGPLPAGEGDKQQGAAPKSAAKK